MTDENELVERVGKAMALADGVKPGWDELAARTDEYRICSKAALSALRPGDRLPGGMVVVQGWQPIETAPKNGLFLAWNERRETVFEVFQDKHSPGRVTEPWSGLSWIATHWMQKPTPPTDTAMLDAAEGE